MSKKTIKVAISHRTNIRHGVFFPRVDCYRTLTIAAIYLHTHCMDENEITPPVVIMQEPVKPGTSVEALKRMHETGRVDTILDGDDQTKGGSGAFFSLIIRSKFQSLFGKLKNTNPPAE